MKTAVYSWRLSPDTKTALEREARRSGMSLAKLLDTMVEAWLRSRHRVTGAEAEAEARIRAAAMRCFGAIKGDNPRRAEQARELVRRRVRNRRAS